MLAKATTVSAASTVKQKSQDCIISTWLSILFGELFAYSLGNIGKGCDFLSLVQVMHYYLGISKYFGLHNIVNEQLN